MRRTREVTGQILKSGVLVPERPRAADQIFEDLRQGILCGDTPRGVRLPAERDLAQQYGVSGATIREAIRGLSLMGLVEARHGSGTYVTADVSALVSLSLGSVIQLERLGVKDVLHVFGLLSVEAARLAADRARPAEVTALREALNRLDSVSTIEEAVASLRAFHEALATASGNALLAALCIFLSNLQLELALKAVEASLPIWQSVLAQLQPARHALVNAVADGKADEAAQRADVFAREAAALITSLPRIQQVRGADPDLSSLIAAVVAQRPL